jgi:hypothetical protein
MILRVRRLLAGKGPKLLNDLAILVSGQFAAMLIATAAFAILAHQLDPQTYGAVEYVAGLTALFGVAVEGGLATVGVRRGRQVPRRPACARHADSIDARTRCPCRDPGADRRRRGLRSGRGFPERQPAGASLNAASLALLLAPPPFPVCPREKPGCRKPAVERFLSYGPGRTRTSDQRIMSPLL